MKKAFTLVELVVVLTILAVLTHLAVREVGSFRNEKLKKAADAQLEEIASAARAFYEDIGRLPKLRPETNANNEVIYTLNELWRRPEDLMPAAFIDAHTNTTKYLDRDGVAVLSVGWNGPYLKLPLGKHRLLDPWGNPIEMVDDGGYGKKPYENLFRIVQSNGVVVAVRHFGADAKPDELTEEDDKSVFYNRDAEVICCETMSCDLKVNVNLMDGAASSAPDFIMFFAMENGLRSECCDSSVGTAVFRNLTPGLKLICDSVSKRAHVVRVYRRTNELRYDVWREHETKVDETK